jgi:hypothetical protein
MKPRQQPGRPARFGAPWAASVRLISAFSVVLLTALGAGIALGVPSEARWAAVFIPVSFLLILSGTALFCVRGYAVDGRVLEVERLLWTTHLPLDGLRAAEADPDAMRWAFKTCGNGGLFAYTGWFRNKRLGSFRAWVTDPRRSVVLLFADRKWVVSPEDPAGFIAALGLPETHRKAGG